MSDDLAARYSRSAETYESMWSPVIRPMAAPLLQEMGPVGGLILDVGCGVGALFGDLSRDGDPVAGFDRSEGMARRAAGRGPVAVADATMLPVRGGSAAAAVAIFMLHHVPQPDRAIIAMAHAVRPGGMVATATWAQQSEHEAGDVWDSLLGEHGAPSIPPTPDSREHADTPQKVSSMMTAAGLTVRRAWIADAEHRYTIDELVALHARYGRRNERLLALPESGRSAVVNQFRARAAERPELLVWQPQVVYAVARV